MGRAGQCGDQCRFLIAAYVMWRRVRGQGLPLAIALVMVLAVIGVGSYLFHTHAQVWAAMADVAPILLFILVYFYGVNRDFLGLKRWPALVLTAMFVPYAVGTAPLFGLVPGLGGSSAYAPVPLLILIFAAGLRSRAPETAKGMTIGAVILILSITFRSLDDPICSVLPMGTHFLWHTLNAIMLGWMIEVYRRYMQGRDRTSAAS